MRNAVLRLPGFVSFAGLLLMAGPVSHADPLGPSSRRTFWVISEIMYHPADRADGKNLEFVEIHNAGLIAEDLGGHRITGEVNFTIPPGTVVAAGGFAVIAPDPASLQAAYGFTGVLGGFTNRLSNAGGNLRLLNPAGAVLLEVDYDQNAPWPAAADGAGPSLVLHRPSFGEHDPRAWAASARAGGSPGAAEPSATSAWRGLTLNEWLPEPAFGLEPFVELFNASQTALDLGACRVTDAPDREGFVIPAGTQLAPGSTYVVRPSPIAVAPADSSPLLLLYSPDGTQVIDAIRAGALPEAAAGGRHPDGASNWQELSAPSPGATNPPPRLHDVVIHEIHYHPISNEDDDEFVELYHRGSETIDLTGWRWVDGIDFEFPPGTRLAPNAYLVVGRNVGRLLANHPHLTSANTIGNYRGSLSDRGERLALARPRLRVSTDAAGRSVTNLSYVVVDEVTYADGGQWGRWSDGGGSSLELIDPRADNRLAGNWADSDESSKAPWTVLEATGVLDLGTGSIDQLQVLAQGAGEFLVDDVEVRGAAGDNLVSNFRFDSGLTRWAAEGTLGGSSWEPTAGTGGSGCLRVVAVARGDTGANRIRTPLAVGLSPGASATLRARLRWMKGHPEALLRLRGNYLEAYGPLAVPRHLGTPGLPNSRALANAAPTLEDLTFFPVLPAANQAVTISVRAADPDGLDSVTLRYRIDPATTTTDLPMRDDGRAPDARAGDGLYTARLPGQSAGNLAAFRILAVDAAPTAAARSYPANEALVRFGEARPSGSLGTYRLWLTQATFNRWSGRPKLDNAPLPATFVYNDERVVHEIGTLFAGSPHISPGYNTPSGNLCGYILVFPEDQPFLGATDVVLDWPGRDATAQQEPTAYWIARELGLPFNHRRYIRLHVNGVTETTRGSIYEDAQQVNGDLMDSWNPDLERGDLFKIEQWFEFSDSLGTSFVGPPRLANYTTTGDRKKLARYRWNWLKRAAPGSVNDYRSLLTLADAANLPDPATYTAQMSAFVDVEEWMRIFATENIVVNLDAWGYDIGKNMYAYRPPGRPWQLHMWDIDWVMLASSQHGYSPRSPLMYRGATPFGEANRDPAVGRLYNHPEFQRAYWRAIEDAVQGPLLPARVAARLDATHAALVAQGVTRSSGAALANPAEVKTWLRNRRDYLLEQLATVAAPFSIQPGPATLSGTNLLEIRGTAPISVRTLEIQGRPFPVNWTSVTQWTARVPLATGNNRVAVRALDRLGAPVPGAEHQWTATFTDPTQPPADALVLNEILYQPALPGAEFVELHNRSRTTAFDLSGWRYDGLGLTWPSGTLILPGEFLVATADRQALAEAHGLGPRVAALFTGQLNPAGDTLSLLQPGATPGEGLLVHRVTYDANPPWPTPAPGSGSSLQLIDPGQDSRRPGNWVSVKTGSPSASPLLLVPLEQSWRYDQSGSDLGTAWREPEFDDRSWPSGGALLYQESATLPGPKTTPLTLGPITFYFRTHFEFPADFSAASLRLTTVIDDGAVLYLNGTEVFRLGMPDGVIHASTLAARNTADATQEGPFLLPIAGLRPGSNGLAVEVHQVGATSTDVTFGLALEAAPPPPAQAASPGSPNSVQTLLPPFPNLWINELQTDNRTGPRDQAGDRDPWVELFNPGPDPVRLDHLFLGDAPTNLLAWPFPPGLVLQPGAFRLVWLDGEPAESTEGELHASFRADPASGLLTLASHAEGVLRVLDSIRYAVIGPDRVVALLPDGNPDRRALLPTATPAAPNVATTPPITVVFNEWMSANQSALADPADGDYEDWFELFNPGPDEADLTGFHLSDDPANPLKSPIPPGTRLPARGFLLVWADEESRQSQPAGDLHVNFRLSQSGESLLLTGPDGQIVDRLDFGPQTPDTADGRWPDGGPVVGPLRRASPRAPNQPPAANPPVRLIGLTLDQSGLVAIAWETQPGGVYRVQAASDLAGPWLDRAPDLTATGSTLDFAEPQVASGQRFYRIARVR